MEADIRKDRGMETLVDLCGPHASSDILFIYSHLIYTSSCVCVRARVRVYYRRVHTTLVFKYIFSTFHI